MKYILYLLFFVFLFIEVKAQQIVKYVDGQVRFLKIMEQTKSNIFYKEWPDTIPNARIKTAFMSDIDTIINVKTEQADSVYKYILAKKENEERKINEKDSTLSKSVKFFVLGRVGTSFILNELDYNLNAFIGVQIHNRVLVGIGTGFESINIGQGFIKINQIPIIPMIRYYTSIKGNNRMFIGFEMFYNKVISGEYNIAWDGTESDLILKMPSNSLSNTIGFSTSIGAEIKRKFSIEIGYKSQYLGITAPIKDLNTNLIAINGGYKL